MAIGAYVIDNAFSGSTYYSANYTKCEVGTFNQPVVLRSLRFKAYSTGTITAKAVCYDNSGTKLGEGTLASITTTGGQYNNLQFNSPINIAAGTVVKIGYFYNTETSGAGVPAVFSTSSTTPVASSPSYASWTRQANGQYISGDANPTTSDTYAIVGGFTFDIPNQPPIITAFNPDSGVINPLDPLSVTWTYSDPESVAQTSAELSWRYHDATTPTTWSSTPTFTTLTAISGTGSSYTVPANTWAFDKQVILRLRVSDGVNWSGYVERDFDTSGWVSSVTGTTATSGNIPAGLKRGGWQQRVRVANSGSGHYGDFTASQAFDSQGPTDKFVLKGGLWHAVPKPYWNGSTWVYPS